MNSSLDRLREDIADLEAEFEKLSASTPTMKPDAQRRMHEIHEAVDRLRADCRGLLARDGQSRH